MTDDYQVVEIGTGTPLRRRWTEAEKLVIFEESHRSGQSIPAVARRRGLGANLLNHCCRSMAERGVAASSSDEGVASISELLLIEDRLRRFERMLGRNPCKPRSRKRRSSGRGQEPNLLSAWTLKDVAR